jgi:hypothetical protein
MRLRLQVPARRDHVVSVTVQGTAAPWKCLAGVGEPVIEIEAPVADGARVKILWEGETPARAECPAVVAQGDKFAVRFGRARVLEVNDPQGCLREISTDGPTLHAAAAETCGHRTAFAKVEQGDVRWWAPIPLEIRPPLEIVDAVVDSSRSVVEFALHNHTGSEVRARAVVRCGTGCEEQALHLGAREQSALRTSAKGVVPGSNTITVELDDGRTVRGCVMDWQPPTAGESQRFECVELGSFFNDCVSEIFKHEYLSPRSPRCSLQMPVHGWGDWCYGGKATPTISDSVLRAAAGKEGRFVSPQGIPFATPGPGDAQNVVFTSLWDNFPDEVIVPLSGRARHAWFLVAGSTHPMHSQLDNGEIIVTYADGGSDRLALHNPTTWWPIDADYQVHVDAHCVSGPHPPRIDLGSGRATLLDLPLDSSRELRTVTVRTVANEVVVGLMSMTLLRP